jgi:hypothetical protein
LGTTHSSTKGSIKLRLAARRAARSLRMASRREGSFENSAKNVWQTRFGADNVSHDTTRTQSMTCPDGGC